MRLLLFIVLPMLAVLSYPPQALSSGLVLIMVVLAFIAFVGISVWRGKSLALTFMIFLQGMNVIIRLMMLFSTTVDKSGQFNFAFLITGLFGLLLSMYLLLRLDQGDVRVLMVD